MCASSFKSSAVLSGVTTKASYLVPSVSSVGHTAMTRELNFQSSLKGTIIGGTNNVSLNSITNNFKSLRSPERNVVNIKNKDRFHKAMYNTAHELRKDEIEPLKEEIIESLNTSCAMIQDCQPTAKKAFVSRKFASKSYLNYI